MDAYSVRLHLEVSCGFLHNFVHLFTGVVHCPRRVLTARHKLEIEDLQKVERYV